MATASTNYRAVARRMRELPTQMVLRGAIEMKRAIVDQLRVDTGGDQILSGAARRRKGRKLSAFDEIQGGRNFAIAIVKASPPKMLGQWAWLQRGTSPREMPKLHMRVGGGWKTGPWTARGSPAKATFTKGVKAGTPRAEQAMIDVWERAHA